MDSVPDDGAGGGAPDLGALIRQIVSEPVTRSVESGAVLFRQGDPVREVYMVESGRLRLQRHTIEGVRLTLQSARAGDMLAEASLFADRYHCEAIADGPGSVLALPRRAILDALDSSPTLARSVMAALASQVIDLRTRLELRGIRSARDRVWHFLSLTADPHREVAVSGPLTEMAEHLGLTPEALYRTLARLERDGLIARDPGMIRIMNGGPPTVRHRTPC